MSDLQTSTPNTESFAALFEESLTKQDMRAGEVNLRVPRAKVRELNASCRVGEVRTNLGTEVVTREGLFPGRTHFFNAAGKAHVNAHVTAGEVDVTLTQ